MHNTYPEWQDTYPTIPHRLDVPPEWPAQRQRAAEPSSRPPELVRRAGLAICVASAVAVVAFVTGMLS